MLKPGLNLQLGQTLTMTPQLQQAIRLLQLSTLELQAEIQQALESNPMLEQAEDDELGADAGDTADTASDANTDDGESGSDAAGTGETVDAGGSEDVIPDELVTDSRWEDIYDASASPRGPDDRDPLENTSDDDGGGLQDHLLWQLHLSHLTPRDQRIGAALIDTINGDGYLEGDVETLAETISRSEEPPVDTDEVEAVRHWLQHCDPLGVGSLDLRECLEVQLGELAPDAPSREAARAVLEHGMDALARRDYKALQRQSGVRDGDELAAALDLIRTLNPRPGAQISETPPEYVVPDVYVRHTDRGWQVDLNPEIAPRIRINDLYAGMVRQVSDARDSAFMRDQLQEARWFIKSLHSRNDTLLRVARAIVERQQGFLEHGEVAMQPLILRDIAEALEMHESTISRVTTQKYMHTPRGVFEFKYFFSSHVGTSDGGECSATAIRAMIRELIEEETPGKPLSDSRLAQILADRGINVARRTVAKYREGMNLPSSSERRQMAAMPTGSKPKGA
ncbi:MULTISPECIES: RNA polymerase factor sigma-54 [unclassified Thioalkalivibrio]|uniref:RNA polymerase factor sigma-54 n=1 Tax=unclassified Thioalkalivibrio TaxID=2621013 RepID=UPI0003816384|nr:MULTISPECIES: RNA polymerase factor sigma-54 [unclassified Thioalkalivibrio]